MEIYGRERECGVVDTIGQITEGKCHCGKNLIGHWQNINPQMSFREKQKELHK
jgi:hypothetical protein